LAAGGAGNGSLGDLRSLVPDATAVEYDEKDDDKDKAGPLPSSGRRTGGGGAGEEGGGGGVQGVPSLGRLASAGSLFNANNGGSVPAEEAMRVDELLLLVLEAGSFFGEQVRAAGAAGSVWCAGGSCLSGEMRAGPADDYHRVGLTPAQQCVRH